jgi:hypothetical protein
MVFYILAALCVYNIAQLRDVWMRTQGAANKNTDQTSSNIFVYSGNLVLQGGTSKRKRAGIFKQSMGARNRVGLGLSYRPARLNRLSECIPWDRFLGSINV